MKFLATLLAIVSVVSAADKCVYQRTQGLCKGDRGQRLAMWRKKNAAWCGQQCSLNNECNLMVVGEGARHLYTGTCELYTGSKNLGKTETVAGDNNGGWACYTVKYCLRR